VQSPNGTFRAYFRQTGGQVFYSGAAKVQNLALPFPTPGIDDGLKCRLSIAAEVPEIDDILGSVINAVLPPATMASITPAKVSKK
jgi:hypothetical protein